MSRSRPRALARIARSKAWAGPAGALALVLLAGATNVGCRRDAPAGGTAPAGSTSTAPAGSTSTTAQPASSGAPLVHERERLDNLSRRILDGLLSEDPGWARSLGVHTYDGKVPSFDRASLEKNHAFLKAMRTELADIRLAELDADRALDHALLTARIAQELFQVEEIDVYRTRPTTYEVLFSVESYLNRNYAPLAKRLESIVIHQEAALKQIPHIRANLRPVLSRPVVETAIKVFSGYVEYLGKDMPKQTGSFDDPALAKRFTAANGALVQEATALVEWLKKEALPKADESHVLGKERYQKLLLAQEGLSTPLAELSAMAEADLLRNKTAYDALPKVKDRPRPAAKDLLATATKIMDEARAFVVDKQIVSFPDDERATVKETPPFMRWNSAFLDGPGVYEVASGGFYYITLPEASWSAKEQREYVPVLGSLRSTTVHEVYPGHFLQGRWERKAPTRAQKMLGSYSFVEGWAHYVEQMMLEEGFAPGVETQYGQLEDALLRSCRFVVSIGIHTGGMTAAEATRRFREDCHQDAATSRQQAARGAFDPGYFAYTLGKLQILALRDEVKRKKGAAFSLRAFHDALLSHGSPPVPLLAVRVKRDLQVE